MRSAALTGALSFQHAKPDMIRTLISERTDPVLFALSRDYVGDTSETIALMWPAPSVGTNTPRAQSAPLPPRAIASGGGGCTEHSTNTGTNTNAPTLTDVVATIATLGKSQLPAQLARWLDALDETGRWALLEARDRRITGRRLGTACKDRGCRTRRQGRAGDRTPLARPCAALHRTVRLAGRPR